MTLCETAFLYTFWAGSWWVLSSGGQYFQLLALLCHSDLTGDFVTKCQMPERW